MHRQCSLQVAVGVHPPGGQGLWPECAGDPPEALVKDTQEDPCTLGSASVDWGELKASP